MQENNRTLASQQSSNAYRETSFSQYLSFRFHNESSDHFPGATKDSINNFIKPMAEIEEDFLTALKDQQVKNSELHDFGFNQDATMYVEENY